MKTMKLTNWHPYDKTYHIYPNLTLHLIGKNKSNKHTNEETNTSAINGLLEDRWYSLALYNYL